MITVVALALLLIGITVVASVFLEERSAHRVAESRLTLLEPLAPPGADEHEGLARGGGRADRILRAAFSFGMKPSWAWRSRGFSLLAIACGAMAVAWIVASWISGFPDWIGVSLGGVAFFAAPRLRLHAEQENVERQFIEIFPDAIEMIVRMLRAGLPVTATIHAVAKESAFPVNKVFADLANQLDIGVDFEDALRAAAERIRLSDFRFFSVAASLQRTTGGNLAATLESLSDIIRKKRALRLKARAVTAEVRMTAYILGGIPLFIVAELMITHPDYLEPLVTDPRGNIIAGLAAGLLLLAFVVIRQMMRSVTRAR